MWPRSHTDDGLVVVDTSSPFLCGKVHDAIAHVESRPPRHRGVHPRPHRPLLRRRALRSRSDARTAGAPPRVVAHEAITARFDRYRRDRRLQRRSSTSGSSARRSSFWPTEYRYPDETYRDRLDLDVGGERFELHHARGETDDHTWVWVPERKVLCTGDLFIWASPNCGNPQKVQRYAIEWARALRHDGRARRRGPAPRSRAARSSAPTACARRSPTSAALLESLHDQTIALMNEGARLDDIVHTVDRARRAARQAVPPPDLRRAGVRRPQRLAALRRLVRRQPGPPQARARRRARGRGRGSSPAARDALADARGRAGRRR